MAGIDPEKNCGDAALRIFFKDGKRIETDPFGQRRWCIKLSGINSTWSVPSLGRIKVAINFCGYMVLAVLEKQPEPGWAKGASRNLSVWFDGHATRSEHMTFNYQFMRSI